jgi:glycosyltransferase involved in cell wall biosynthesis
VSDRTGDQPTRGRLLMVGPFPPPLGGAAKITAAMRAAADEAGIEVQVVDTSGSALSHSRSIGYHVGRLVRNVRGAASVLAASRRAHALYLVPDGGFGVWYTLLHTLAAGRFRQVFVHHHTGRYVDDDDRAVRLMTRILGDRARHILLTPSMARRFDERYGPIRHLVLGNAWFTAPEPLAGEPDEGTPRPVRLGHLSNLCREKGFFRVVEAFERLRATGIDVELHLAGPCVEPAVQPRIDRLRQDHGDRVVYHGPLYDDDKSRFYRSLDLFLFPTEFGQEAAPNVLFEAAAAGVPTLSVDRACIAELLEQLAGACCERDADFGAFVLAHVGRDVRPLALDQRIRVRERFERAREQARGEASGLLEALVSCASLTRLAICLIHPRRKGRPPC